MRKFGLIGYPLSHSFSKTYFTKKFHREKLINCEYANYAIESIELLPEIIKNNSELHGLNVTIPYKEDVLQYLDDLHEDVRKIGAVNTIKIIQEEGSAKLMGFNTDAYGFYHSLKPFLKQSHKSALILGTGGASKAVAFSLQKLGIDFLFCSRTPSATNHLAYKDLTEEIINKYKVIINTSPIGMYPDIDKYPDIPYPFINNEHILYDLIYNPETTSFLKKGEKQGAIVINGMKMLELQAEKAWEIWNSQD